MGLLDAVGLQRAFVAALGSIVIRHTDMNVKPLELDCGNPLPLRLRVYLYNLTHPPGARTEGEHKIQLIAPGHQRGNRGTFDTSGGRFVLLCGYEANLGVFVLWDADRYPTFTYSRNLQVRRETLYSALGTGLSEQPRRLRGGELDIVIAARDDALADAIGDRFGHRIARLAERVV